MTDAAEAVIGMPEVTGAADVMRALRTGACTGPVVSLEFSLEAETALRIARVIETGLAVQGGRSVLDEAGAEAKALLDAARSVQARTLRLLLGCLLVLGFWVGLMIGGWV